jgi:hypothetical protein
MKKVHKTIRVNESVVNDVNALAINDGRSFSNMVEVILSRFLSEKSQTNSDGFYGVERTIKEFGFVKVKSCGVLVDRVISFDLDCGEIVYNQSGSLIDKSVVSNDIEIIDSSGKVVAQRKIG